LKKNRLKKNKISKISFDKKRKNILSKKDYIYLFKNKLSEKKFDLKKIKSLAILVLQCGKKSYLNIENKKINLKKNKVIIIENKKVILNFDKKENTLLIAGTKSNKYKNKKISEFNLNKSYKVKKHWGHELWINGRNSNFAFKKIFLKKGNKTSLQYHNKKKETNFLYKGKIFLHYLSKNKNFADINFFKDIKKKFLKGPVVIDVEPKTIHRIEAVTDLTLYETSTPHLDDVIRLQDDKSRGSGLIQYEHSKT
tara:strand:- start:663 stop:1421 length:759 start_codon:yes stop_codon:yes gene_type:complete